ncbi:streptavidin-V2-like [Saccostrea echinata]|uniref:streptavidin-V2-like n=1 Tax=Saccostrea echinata TaxID=191078 RepID=UPI002A836653|nr:streptavidin-V2-like [Saccostrea echinata]
MLCYFTSMLICGVLLVHSSDSVAHNDPCKTHGQHGNQCALAGKWRNQYKSEMTIFCQNATFTGQYTDIIGDPTQNYVLVGKYIPVNNTEYITGWSVAFKNEYHDDMSVKSWSGVFYAAHGNIKTHWVHAKYVKPNDYWRTFSTNQDTFIRTSSDPCLPNSAG